MKRCGRCGDVTTRFHACKSAADGLQAFCINCKKKGRRKDLDQRAKADRLDILRRRVDDLKNNPCLDCKRSYPAICMDFDHRDPSTKRKSVSDLLVRGTRWALVLKEIGKCDLVCSNCHRIRTRNRGYVVKQ